MWKKIAIIQSVGYVLAIAMSPITICIFEREFPGGERTWMTFPIVSFIVWGVFIVLPTVYAYVKKIEHKNICFRVLWIPPVIVILLYLIPAFLCIFVFNCFLYSIITLSLFNKTYQSLDAINKEKDIAKADISI